MLVLEGTKPDRVQGNLLVDYLLGAEIIFAPTRQAQRAALDAAAARCVAAGGRPHILNDNPMFDVASAIAYLETMLKSSTRCAPSMRLWTRSTCRRAARGRPGWCSPSG